MLQEATEPDISEIEQAAERLQPILTKVPLLESERLNELAGGRLLVKAETLQPTGSFKVRGAWNRIALLSAEEKARGIIALSSGNHGRAVAWAARAAGIARVVILMPADSPVNKIESTRSLGAQVDFYERKTVDRAALVSSWQEKEGLVQIQAYDDRHIIAGAGTIGLEIANSAAEGGYAIDHVYAACAGGGLITGNAVALKALSPDTQVWAVEPEKFDDMALSLEQDRRVTISTDNDTICEALLAPTPGDLNFRIARTHLAGVLRGSDTQAILGMKVAFQEFGLVAEPSGALALGRLLSDRRLTKGLTTVAILSGRNVDLDFYASRLGAFKQGEA